MQRAAEYWLDRLHAADTRQNVFGKDVSWLPTSAYQAFVRNTHKLRHTQTKYALREELQRRALASFTTL